MENLEVKKKQKDVAYKKLGDEPSRVKEELKDFKEAVETEAATKSIQLYPMGEKNTLKGSIIPPEYKIIP